MGKPEEGTTGAGRDESAEGSAWCCGNSTLCKKSTCRWIISVVLSLQLLAFAVLSIPFLGRTEKDALEAPSYVPEANVQASFRLRRDVSVLNASLSQLESDLQDEVGVSNAQVAVFSLRALPSSNWTEVVFGVLPVPLNQSISPADMSVLKETFVELFLEQSVKLSLTADLFGKVYCFEIIEFPGGITAVPEQPGFPLLKLVVLFNFTLHNTISHINCNFEEFRQQLADGIRLKSKESLFVQLTSSKGSTLKSPIIVQTSIIPIMGVYLPRPRLKQLAREISACPKRNLGLNFTVFGRVKGIKLSSYLQWHLKPARSPSAVRSSPSVSFVHPPYPPRVAAPQGAKEHEPPFSHYISSTTPSRLPHHHKTRVHVFHSPSHHRYRHFTPSLSPRISPNFQPSPLVTDTHPPLDHHSPSPLHNSTSSSPSSLPSTAQSPIETFPRELPLVPAPLFEPLHSFPGSPSIAIVAPQSNPARSQISELTFSVLELPLFSALTFGFPLWTMATSFSVVVIILV